jgi:polyisoprenoid-binding protein YceI
MRLTTLLLLFSALCFGQRPQTTLRRIDPQRSSIVVHADRAGFFSFAGDNHTISAPISSGTVNESTRTVELTINAAGMRVLDPQLSPAKRAQVQQRMLGAEVLDVAHYPESANADAHGGLKIHGELTLRGRTHPVDVIASGSGDHYRGSARFRQTEFGIQPITIAGGAVKVKDELKIEFEIFLKSQ